MTAAPRVGTIARPVFAERVMTSDMRANASRDGAPVAGALTMLVAAATSVAARVNPA